MRFLVRRLLHAVFLLVGTSILSFALVSFLPGDFFDSMTLNPQISPTTAAAIRQQHGLERPLPVRYLDWIRSGLSGDWGFSFAYNVAAAPIVLSRAKNTLLLAATATLLAWIIAVPLGTWAATDSARWSEWLTTGTISVLLATPELVLALLLLMFAVRTGYFPSGGLASVRALTSQGASGAWIESKDIALHLALPCICLASGLLPMLLLHIRSAVRETLQSPFVEAARAYGIPFHRVLLRYVLPAAANPLISLLGLSLGMLMSSSLLIEVIFSWPGLGKLLVEAILQRDIFLVIDSTMLAATFLVGANFLADLLLYANDPRIRSV
jgi:peptide/nickel transport system permease protein